MDAASGDQQILPLGSGGLETRQCAALGCIHRWMNGTLAPFNEERKQAAVIVLETKSLPTKNLAIGTLARTGLRAFEFNPRLAKLSGKLFQVVAMRGPTDEARLLERGNDGVLFHTRLFGIGRDNLEIAARPEREQSVLRASTGVDAPKRGANAAVLFNERDAALEIAAAEKKVIEQCRNLGNLWPSS